MQHHSFDHKFVTESETHYFWRFTQSCDILFYVCSLLCISFHSIMLLNHNHHNQIFSIHNNKSKLIYQHFEQEAG